MKTINDTTKTAETTKTTAPSFSAILTLIFIVLKLTGNISWSWIWVLAPMWINLILAVVLIIIVAVAMRKSGKKN